MNKVSEWTCGNVDVKAELTLPDGTPTGVATLAVEGLTQILQRKPSSAWEKAEAGYEKRPDGFKRNSIAFSEESADKLVSGFSAALPEGVKVEFSFTEHVEGETAKPSKESIDLWKKVAAMQGEQRASTLKVLGVANASDEDAGIVACHAYLRKVKKDALEAAKAALGTPRV